MNPSFHKYQLIFSVFKGILFSSFWKVLSVVPVFKNVEERPTPEKYRPASLLSIVNKIFEKTVKNDELFDHFEKCAVFPDFLHGFRFPRSDANLPTVGSDRIARAFNMSQATKPTALDISKGFHRVWHAVLLLKVRSYGFQACFLALFCLFR